MTLLSDIERARFNMVEQQIRPWDVLDQAVLNQFLQLKREDFVPAAYRNLAFADLEIPLPRGQNMLPPKVEARLLQSAAVQPTDRVLEVGTGSGFMAALLASFAQSVVSVELEPELKSLAEANLKQAGIDKVQVVAGNGLAPSLPALGTQPFDVIVLSGSVIEVPSALLARLAPGGRLLAIVGTEPVMTAQLITRVDAQALDTVNLFETVAAPLVEAIPHSRFKF